MTADDVAAFVAIVQAKLADGYPFEPAVRAALKGVLISPEFLFLRERPGSSTTLPWPAGCLTFSGARCPTTSFSRLPRSRS